MISESKKNAGFTLIEVIIYIGLFAIVIGGGMLATYSIIQSTSAGTNQVILQEEANFLLRKIDWALTGAIPPVNVLSATRLEVTNSSGAYTFNICGVNLTIQAGSGKTCNPPDAPITLNSSSIAISAIPSVPVFVKTPTNNGFTTAFRLTTVQNGRNVFEDFSTTKYLRQ